MAAPYQRAADEPPEGTGARDADTTPAAPPAQGRPWYDLGFTFTTRQALMLLALLAGGVAISYAFDFLVSRFVDLEERRIGAWIGSLGVLGPLAYIGLLAATIMFSPLPSVPVNIAGGLAFGVFWGTVYTLIGGMIGATVNFYIARRLGRGYVARRLGRQTMSQIDAMAERMGARVIFLMRLIPLFNFDWVSYAAGLTSIRYRTYAVASLLGMTPPVIGIVYVGDQLLSHPGRAAMVFTVLVVWSALPPVLFLMWATGRAVLRRARLRRDAATAEAAAAKVER